MAVVLGNKSWRREADQARCFGEASQARTWGSCGFFPSGLHSGATRHAGETSHLQLVEGNLFQAEQGLRVSVTHICGNYPVRRVTVNAAPWLLLWESVPLSTQQGPVAWLWAHSEGKEPKLEISSLISQKLHFFLLPWHGVSARLVRSGGVGGGSAPWDCAHYWFGECLGASAVTLHPFGMLIFFRMG